MLAAVTWDGGGDGTLWSDRFNWTGDQLPGASDDVTIDVAANPNVVVSTGAHSIKSLQSAEALNLSGGTLQVSGTVQVDNTFTFSGGTLQNATVLPAVGGQRINVFTTGTLDGVTLNSDLRVANFGELFVSNGLVLNGVLTVDSQTTTSTFLTFRQGVQTLAGTGQVMMAGTLAGQFKLLGTTLTVAPGITIRGKGMITQDTRFGSGTLVNQGTIAADVAGGTLYVDLNSFTNEATMRAASGGTLEMRGNWTNAGQIDATASTLTASENWTNAGVITATNATTNLGGTFTMAQLGTFNRTGGVVNLTGVLDNRDKTLALNAATGSWSFVGGTIWGGTVTTADGASLSVGVFTTGTLDGVTLNSDLRVANFGELFVSNGLVLNGVLTVDSQTTTSTFLTFRQGVQTLAGTGQVMMAGTLAGQFKLLGTTLTVAPGITIRGKGMITQDTRFGSGTLVNQGTIAADVAGGTLYVDLNSFTNEATMRAAGGGILDVAGNWENAGVISETSSTLNLGGQFKTSLGTISGNGGTVNFTGTVTNDGELILPGTAISPHYTLRGGTILGGRIITTGGAELFATGGGTLDAVTFAGTLHLGEILNTFVNVRNGLTLDDATVIMEGNGALNFQGSQSLAGTGTVRFADGDTRKVLSATTAGTVLTVGSGISISGVSGSIGRANGGAVAVQGEVASDGGGTITVHNIANFAAGTLTGGLWKAEANSTLRMVGADIVTNAAMLIFDGAASHIYSGETSTVDALANLSTNAASGSLTLKNGAFLATPALSNTGEIRVETSGTLAPAAYAQTAGTTSLSGGNFGAPLPAGPIDFDLHGGALSGNGTINANLLNAAVVAPGNSPGRLDVLGRYTQLPAGTLNVEIGGVAPGSGYDQLNVSGAAALEGALNVSLVNGFGPTAGQDFDVVAYASRTGGFATYTGIRSGRFNLFDPVVGATGVTLHALNTLSNLTFQSFDAAEFPATAVAGENVTLKYTVTNSSEFPLDGGWVDSVYLSRDEVIDPSDALLTRIEHEGGLAGMASYTETVSAAVPALVDGTYRVIVLTDSRGLAPDADRTNNMGVSSQSISVSVPSLPIGVTLEDLLAPGQDRYYRVLPAPGDDLLISADFGIAHAEAYWRRGSLPDRTNFDEAADPDDFRPEFLLSNPTGGAHYVLLHGREDALTPLVFTLKAELAGFRIAKFTPDRGTNLEQASTTTMRVVGSGFTPTTTLELSLPGGAARTAKSLTFIDANHLTAIFDLLGLEVGSYNVIAHDAGEIAIAPDAFRVTDAGPGFVNVNIIAPAYVRVGASIPVQFEVHHSGSVPAFAPILVVNASNVAVGQQKRSFFGASDQLPLRLPPSSNGNVSISYQPEPKANHVVSDFELSIVNPSTTFIDWDAQKDQLRPRTISPEAWEAIWQILKPELGQSLAELYDALVDNAEALLNSSGELVNSLQRLFQFEIRKANGEPGLPIPVASFDLGIPAPGIPLIFGRSFGSTISHRYHTGRMGRGWTDTFDMTISEDSTGLVMVRQGSQLRFFYPEKGHYIGFPGETGSLTKFGDVFHLREQSGELTAFRADGNWDYLQDNNGNRLEAEYSGEQLTSVTHNNASKLTFTYNTDGRIEQVTDSLGNIASYEYDDDGEHLLRVTTSAGVTDYAYTSDEDGPRAHAITAATYVDGTHSFFEYDNHGRLVKQEADGGVGLIRFTYNAASFTITNANDQTVTLGFDENFRIRGARDAIGNASNFTFDMANNLTSAGATGAGTSVIEYDAFGRPSVATNPMGETLRYSYDDTHNQLSSIVDSLGRETMFTYDANGNLVATTHPDGSVERFEYDESGNIARSIDRIGQSIRYTYNTHGQLTRKQLPDGSQIDYTYDARGNIETATDATGTTRFERHDPIDPDLITRITYPNGRFLDYVYEKGRRIRMVDQTGFAVNYTYDMIGRLDRLTNGAGELIVDYDFDAVGRLYHESRGNGTSTDYSYDTAGQLMDIFHRAPDGSVQSQFVYAYDSLGRRVSMTTMDGVTTYDYDDSGRLTYVQLPSGREITYGYDAAGNRTVVTDNGVETAYSTNDLNQYTSFGGSNQTFDRAGNLVSSSSPNRSNSYSYDAEGRLIRQVTPQGIWTYEYDVLGNRVASTHNGVRTEYLVDPFGLGDVVGEYDGAGEIQAQYVYGIGLASSIRANGSATYFQYDAVGNTSELTGAGGATLNRYQYLPFGETLHATEAIANLFQFNGRLGIIRDGSGLDFMRNRWYDAAQGRFTQADPIGIAGGMNLYTFANNNAVAFVDPSGLVAWYNSLFPATAENAFLLGRAIGSEFVTRVLYGVPNPIGGGSTLPPGIPPSVTSPWSPSIPADPLARSILPNGVTYAQAGLQFQQAYRNYLYAQQVTRDLRAAARVAQTAGLVAVGILEGAVLINLWSDISYYLINGTEQPCFPGIPAKYQFCKSPDLPDTEPGGLASTEQRAPEDPNDIVGPAGAGAVGAVLPQSLLPYVINFENKADASAWAAEVVVTHQLGDDLDLDTFQLGSVGFGDVAVETPAGKQTYSTRLDLRSTLSVFVDVDAKLNRANRTVTWTLRAIDPTTLDLPIDPFIGFLPPNQTSPEGQGFVTYSIQPKAGLASGTQITAQASIVFDVNEPILTNVWLNTIDDASPASSVDPLPSTNPASFNVSWDGADDAGGPIGSGIETFDIFVSVDGGEFALWLDDTTERSALYQGQADHTYAFYSIATDNLGHAELPPDTADALTHTVRQPSVMAAIVQDGLSQRSYVDTLVIDFDRQMNLAELINDGTITSAVTLSNLGLDADRDQDHPIALAANQFQYEFDEESGLSRLSWSLEGFADARSSLADGFYQFVIYGSLVTDVHGIQLDANGDGIGGDEFVLSFHRLQGDADGDMQVDQEDMDLINAALGTMPTSASWNDDADLGRDNRVTVRDRIVVARAMGNQIVPSTVTDAAAAISLPGDYNGDGTVDGADYSVWRDNVGTFALTGLLASDGDGDGDVDNADYTVWKRNFGRTLVAISGATQLATSTSGLATITSESPIVEAQIVRHSNAVSASTLRDGDRLGTRIVKARFQDSSIRDEVFAALANTSISSASMGIRQRFKSRSQPQDLSSNAASVVRQKYLMFADLIGNNGRCDRRIVGPMDIEERSPSGDSIDSVVEGIGRVSWNVVGVRSNGGARCIAKATH